MHLQLYFINRWEIYIGEGENFLIENNEVAIANFFQLVLVIAAILLLGGIIKKRPELRLWLMGEIILVISYIVIICYRLGYGEILQIYDAILKFSAISVAIIAVFLDYRKLYPRKAKFQSNKKEDLSFAIAFFPLSIFAGITIIACFCLYLAMRNYQKKRTPTYAFMAFFMGVVIFTAIIYSLRFIVESTESLQIWVVVGNITYATTLLAFSIVARVEIDIVQSREMKNNLITFAAHELKTPLIPIFGWADFMLSSAEKGLDLNKLMDLQDIKSIQRNAERLKMIVDRFLDVTMLESRRFHLERESISLLQMISEALKSVNNLAANKNILITQKVSEAILFVDAFRMQQVFTNLLSNGIKYSPPNTIIQITTQNSEKEFEIIFQDQGSGFTTEELQDALKPFSLAFLRKRGSQPIPGTGVGLSICEKVIEQHGGRIKIESPGQNQGTTVRIILPRLSCLKS